MSDHIATSDTHLATCAFTWAVQRAAIETLLDGGLPPDAAEAVRRATAPGRQAARVAAVYAALSEAVGTTVGPLREREEDRGAFRRAWALARVEISMCSISSRTRRPKWASGLGRGRRQAMDGGAWTAAIATAEDALYWATWRDVDDRPTAEAHVVAGIVLAEEAEASARGDAMDLLIRKLALLSPWLLKPPERGYGEALIAEAKGLLDVILRYEVKDCA